MNTVPSEIGERPEDVQLHFEAGANLVLLRIQRQLGQARLVLAPEGSALRRLEIDNSSLNIRLGHGRVNCSPKPTSGCR